MGRGSFFMTSLVAAVPAGLLTAVLVQAFLSHVGSMTTVPLVLAGATLAISSFLVVTPFGILVFGGPKKKKVAAAKSAKDKKQAVAAAVAGDESIAESVDVDLETSGEAHVLDSDDDMSIAAGSDVELDDTTAFETPLSNPDIELTDSDAFATDQLVDMDDLVDEVVLEEDEDDEPKRKKKRR